MALIDKLLKNKAFNGILFSPNQVRTARMYFQMIRDYMFSIGCRSVCSCINNVTENVDIFLQPLMKKLPTFIRDTTDFINLIVYHSDKSKHIVGLY